MFRALRIATFAAMFLAVAQVASRQAHCDDTTSWAGRMTAEELRQQGFARLFNGKSLDGWNVKPWHQGHWIVRDGMIDHDGKGEGKQHRENCLWTRADYGDLEIYAEWRLPSKPKTMPHPIVLYNGDFLMEKENPQKRVTRPRLDAGDSGLYFRGSPKYQVNIWSQELGSGEINGYRTDRNLPPEVRRACIPIKNADRPFGKWNAFLITLEGDRMTVVLNDQKVIDDVCLPDLPVCGPIALQHHGDPVQFRQLWIKELD